MKPAEKIKCPECKQIVRGQNNLKTHNRKLHEKTGLLNLYTFEGTKEITVTRNEDGKFHCGSCRKRFCNLKQFRTHHKVKHNPNAKVKSHNQKTIETLQRQRDEYLEKKENEEEKRKVEEKE